MMTMLEQAPHRATPGEIAARDDAAPPQRAPGQARCVHRFTLHARSLEAAWREVERIVRERSAE